MGACAGSGWIFARMAFKVWTRDNGSGHRQSSGAAVRARPFLPMLASGRPAIPRISGTPALPGSAFPLTDRNQRDNRLAADLSLPVSIKRLGC
jgi:hypothetical protein